MYGRGADSVSVELRYTRNGPVPGGSGPYTPDRARYGDDFSRRHGATYREVFDLAD